MLKVVNIQDSKRSIERGGLLFRIVFDQSEIKADDHEVFDAFVIASESDELQLLTTIRRLPDKYAYLKPVLSEKPIPRPNRFDGDFENLDESLISSIRSINDRIGEIKTELRSIEPQESILTKCCQYLFTRKNLWKPYSTRHSSFGFHWPFLSEYMSVESSEEVFSLLKTGERKKYLQGKVQDKVHLCKSCSGNYLNFRESCPKCASIDLQSKDLVHHFVCAHVAPEEEFLTDEGMQCPKCDRKMRHIGIDYDKPSSVYQCNCCDHQFQEADMKASCIDCGTEHNLSDLREEVIKEYSLTGLGEELAKYGLIQEAVPPEDNRTTTNFLFFKIFANQELHRSQIRGASSYLCHFKLNSILIQDLDQHSRETLQLELISIIQEYLKPSDVLCAKNASEYLTILADYKESEAKELSKMVEENLNRLLADNLSNDERSISVQQMPISENGLMKLGLL